MGKSYVVDVRVVDIQKKRSPRNKQRHYVYGLRVEWSDSAVFCIYRKYSMFFEFQAKLYEIFPYTQDSGIPAFPAKIFGRVQLLSVEKKAKKIENFCQALVKLPAVISQCDDVLGFFEAWPEDMRLKLDKGDLKTNPFYAPLSSRPAQGNSDDGFPLYQDVGDSVMEVEHELEQYKAIAAFLGRGPNEVPIELGAIVHVIDKNDNGWWLVQVGDKEGRAPGSYLEPVDQAQTPEDQQEEESREEETYRAVADYNPQDQDELALEEGDEIHVFEKNLDGWWKVKCNGKIGFAPSTYLRPEERRKDNEDIYALPMAPPPRRGSAEKWKSGNQPRSGSGMFEVKRSVCTDDGGYVMMTSAERRRSSGASSGAGGDAFTGAADPKPTKGRAPAGYKRDQVSFKKQPDSCTSLERNFYLMTEDFSEPGGLHVQKGEQVQVSKHDDSGWSYALSLRSPSPGHTSSGWVPTNNLQRHAVAESPLSPTSPTSKGPPSLSINDTEVEESIYVATENYVSSDLEMSMSFNKGERVTLVEKKGSGWWFVRIDSFEGWVPGAFFEPAVKSPTAFTAGIVFNKRFTDPIDDEENDGDQLRLSALSDPEIHRGFLRPSKSLGSSRSTSSPQLENESEHRPSVAPSLSPRMPRKAKLPQGDEKFDLTNQVWYHGSMSRQDAEALLLKCGRDREFLVRESPNRVGSYAISVLFESRVRHFTVETKNERLFIGNHFYNKMSEIVKYYQSFALFFIENNAKGVTLALPVRSRQV